MVATIHGIVAFINGLGLPWAAEVEKDFGRPVPYGELFSTEGQVDVPHKYTGKELDPETGFYFYEARYYDPQLGRFITPDTIVPNWTDPQDFNRYTYAANNPLKYTDPTGHKPFWKKVKKFFKKAWQAIVTIGAIAAAPFTGGQSLWLLAGMQVYNGAQSIRTGQFGAFAAGLAAGLLTAGFANAIIAPAMAGFFTGGGVTMLTHMQAAIITGVEFGLAGAAGGFVGTLAAGGSLSEAGRAAGIGFGIGAVTGGIIGYTYHAGLQNVLHGFESRVYDAGTLQGRGFIPAPPPSQNLPLIGERTQELTTSRRIHPAVLTKKGVWIDPAHNLTVEQAATHLRGGNKYLSNIWAEAGSDAQMASTQVYGKTPALHTPHSHDKGYYWHYHPVSLEGRKMDSHAWFGPQTE